MGTKTVITECVNGQGGGFAVQHQLGKQQTGNRADAETMAGKAAGNGETINLITAVNDRYLISAFIHGTAPGTNQLGVLQTGKNCRMARAAVGAEIACERL